MKDGASVQYDGDSPAQAASNAADSFTEWAPGPVTPCGGTSSAGDDETGSLTLPTINVVGDPKEGKAYAEGYQDGLEGTPDKYSRMSGLRTGTTQTIMVNIRLHTTRDTGTEHKQADLTGRLLNTRVLDHQ
jgi:hypothetical protein